MNYTYDPDDRLGTDQYDPDGNTVGSGGITNTYDFENHLITHGGVTIAYDGDGNRVSETVAGVTTNCLVDTQNPTGYAQVIDELQNGTVTKTYAYGLERISQNWQVSTSTWQPNFYGYDGHGSVRQLTNSAGAVTDTYDYDAFGNLINSTGSTPNNYLFAGEQYDPALGLYYNRARYLNTTTGRFWSMDLNEGEDEDPPSLHKYTYANGSPVDSHDPTGHETLGDVAIALNVSLALVNSAGALYHAYRSITASSADEAHAENIAVWEDVAGTAIALLGAGSGSIGPRLAVSGMTQATIYAEAAIPAAQRIGTAAASFLFFAVATQGGSSSGGTGSATNVTVQQNYSSGTNAAKKFFDDLEKQGIRVVARDGIHIDTPLGARVPDGIIEINGKYIGIEVKSGNASRSALQGAKDMYINLFGGKAFGSKAARAGIESIQGMRTFFVP